MDALICEEWCFLCVGSTFFYSYIRLFSVLFWVSLRLLFRFVSVSSQCLCFCEVTQPHPEWWLSFLLVPRKRLFFQVPISFSIHPYFLLVFKFGFTDIFEFCWEGISGPVICHLVHMRPLSSCFGVFGAGSQHHCQCSAVLLQITATGQVAISVERCRFYKGAIGWWHHVCWSIIFCQLFHLSPFVCRVGRVSLCVKSCASPEPMGNNCCANGDAEGVEAHCGGCMEGVLTKLIRHTAAYRCGRDIDPSKQHVTWIDLNWFWCGFQRMLSQC